MPRYRLTLEYDGRPYCGFQAQAALPSVQASLERAIEAFCGERLRVQAAGRTDTGVHATGQVIHVDLAKAWAADVVRDALNAHLSPEPIAVLAAVLAPDDFHALFGDRAALPLPHPGAPGAAGAGQGPRLAAQGAARRRGDACNGPGAGPGRHDFTTFRDARCQARSPVKTLEAARVWREGEEVRLEFAARSFLHRQVRSMAGSLVQVGLGRWPMEALKTALDARDRSACGPVAPPDGLYLVAVDY